jgi:hypothetical protein
MVAALFFIYSLGAISIAPLIFFPGFHKKPFSFGAGD